MKAIVYGRERTTKKLSDLLKNEGIEVKIRQEGQSDTGDWQAEGDFDLAIVESCADTAETTCRNIRESGNTPVAVLINPKSSDWNTLLRLDADCYIPETKEITELAARIRAILRRYAYEKEVRSIPFNANKTISLN